MVSKDSIVYPRRPTFYYADDDMRGDMMHAKIMTVFPSWSSQRMSRWLGVSSRTLQRWLAAGKGQVPTLEVPEDLQHKISAQAMVIEETKFPQRLDEFIAKWTEGPPETSIDKEVLAAWLADRYAKLIGREID